jgi:cell division septum initiation protein DivIVA
MAGIDFDRQVFAPTSDPPPSRRVSLQAFLPLLFVVALGALGVIGYRIYNDSVQATDLRSSQSEVEQLRQQVSVLQKRIDQLEKHRKPAQSEPTAAPLVQPVPAQKSAPQHRIVYQVTSASRLPATPKPSPAAPPAAPSAAANANNAAVMSELTANHEAWQATTDRLTDVVGVVGEQQGEISATREDVNRLLAQSKRRAISFELQRGSSPMPVGPLALQLKSVDAKAQRYSACVYFGEKCIALKNRVLNEVVVFVVAKNGTPMELVATKILRDQIVGYVEIPADGQLISDKDR